MPFSQTTTSVTIISSNLIGYQAISLTNFNDTSEPAIASGSSIEIAGAFFKADSDVAISDWASITTGLSCYIALTPSGSAGSQTLAASFTTIAPVWVTDKNGWYASAASSVRYVGSVYKNSETEYLAKTLIENNQKSVAYPATNFAVGPGALKSITTGIHNIAIGYATLYGNTTGRFNVAIGTNALLGNVDGTDNIAMGFESLKATTSGVNCVGIGTRALYSNTTGSENIAIGKVALYSNVTGKQNIAIGSTALQNNLAGNNIAIGNATLVANTTGGSNIAIGSNALNKNITGANNTAVGIAAGSSLTTGVNNICFGYNAQAPASNSSNIISLGDGNITVLRCQVTSITALSDKRDKTLIHDISLGVDFINTLSPVEFNWDRRDWYENKTPDGSKMGKKDYGFIAQDLLAIQEKFNAPWLDLVMQENPEKLETTTGKLMPVVIKAIQELSNEIQMLKEIINA